jgi:hypothetical protein
MRSMKTQGGLTRGRGLTESVRNQWVFSLPTSIAIHDAMMARTDTKIVCSDQHEDLSKSRNDQDLQDINTLSTWFNDNNPFDPSMKELRSLSTGLCATYDQLNCDRAEEVGSTL